MSASINHLEERIKDEGDPLFEIMPAAITLAMMLRHRKLAGWLRVEFEGYPEGESLPPYRREIAGHIMAKFPQYGWIPAPVDKQQNLDFGCVDISEGVKVAERVCMNCKKGTGNQIKLCPERLALLRSQINQTGDLAITISRVSYCKMLRTIRSAVYLWSLELIELGLTGDHNSFKEADKVKAAHLDNPEVFWRRAMEEEANLPIPDVRSSGFFERMFGRTG